MKLRAFAILVVIAALIGCFTGCEILGLGTPEQPDGGNTVCQHIDADKDEFCDECGEEYTDGSADVSPECEHENTEWAEENVKEPT